MASNFANSCNVNATMDQAVFLFHDRFFYDTLGFTLLSESITPMGATFYLQHGVSFSSWGESISVNIVALDRQTLRVDVYSECDMPTQIVDWGKNRENVDKIFQYVFANIGRYAGMAQNAAPKKFCTKCGKQLAFNANFCSGCGEKQG